MALKGQPFSVFDITFSDKKDFTKRIGYKSQLSHNLITKRYGSWEDFLRKVVYPELSDSEIKSRLKTISLIQQNKDKIHSLLWKYFEMLNNSINPELKNNLISNIVNSESGITKEILEAAIRTELKIQNKM